MPSSSSQRSLIRKTATPIQRVTRPAVYPIKPAQGANCHSCNALPAGSMEVAALLLVLVFSLSAVLFTSVYATRVQTAKVEVLEQQVASYTQQE